MIPSEGDAYDGIDKKTQPKRSLVHEMTHRKLQLFEHVHAQWVTVEGSDWLVFDINPLKGRVAIQV